MEHRFFVFKIGLIMCGLSALVLELPAMTGRMMATPLIGGLSLAFIGIAALLMSLAFKLDNRGIRALLVIAVSIGVFAAEFLFSRGRGR